LKSYTKNKRLIALLFLILLSADSDAADRRAVDFSLKNWDGKTVSMQDLRGKAAVLTFSYSFCSVRCPIITGRLDSLDKSMGSRKDVVYVHISIDPDNDTPERRKKYFGLYGIDVSKDDRWMFLSGKKNELSKLWKIYGVAAKKVRDKKLPEGYFMDYAPKVVVIDNEGIVRYEAGSDFSEDEVKGLIEKINGKPLVKFMETKHDFGIVTEGDVVTHEFEFINEGSGVLKIKDVIPA
jgi:cytochrome oxidase Cu insertion factor (SCO1/SenC/PrrC family)